jgi:hypothetical protein
MRVYREDFSMSRYDEIFKDAFDQEIPEGRPRPDWFVLVENEGHPVQFLGLRRNSPKGVLITDSGWFRAGKAVGENDRKRYFQEAVNFLHQEEEYMDCEIRGADRDWLIFLLAVGFTVVGSGLAYDGQFALRLRHVRQSVDRKALH